MLSSELVHPSGSGFRNRTCDGFIEGKNGWGWSSKYGARLYLAIYYFLPAQGECPLHRRSVVRLRACGCRLQPARSCYIVAAGRGGCSWRNLGVFSDQVFLVCNYKTINKHQWPTAPNYRYGSSSTVWLHGYLSITLIINTAISQVNLLKKGAQRHKDTCTCYCYFCVRGVLHFFHAGTCMI